MALRKFFLVESYTYEESTSETASARNVAYDNKEKANDHGNHHLCNLHHNSHCEHKCSNYSKYKDRKTK